MEISQVGTLLSKLEDTMNDGQAYPCTKEIDLSSLKNPDALYRVEGFV